MTEIVVSRRDGVLTAPDGTKYRVARGRTLANAQHPAVLANPRDWTPMVITLDVDGAEPLTPGGSHAETGQLENDVAELEETLALRDAELTRLVEGLAARGVALPAEGDREPGWLVDLVLEIVSTRVAPHEPEIAPPPVRPRKRAAPLLTTRTRDHD